VLRTVGEAAVLWDRDRARAVRVPMSAVAPQPTPTLDAVWRELHAPLSHFVARRVSDPSDAEDVVQDVILRIQRHVDEIDQVDHLAAWMHKVARNAIIDFYRRRAARREQQTDMTELIERTMDIVSEAPPPADTSGELARCLSPLIARLSATYREALQLTELGGLTQTEAAQKLGLSTSGMKARVQRARAQLRRLLLECCEVQLDRRGGVTDYEPRSGGCGPCGAEARR
jgi:RNA polymerase sigma-70 factor, ECF subfamily